MRKFFLIFFIFTMSFISAVSGGFCAFLIASQNSIKYKIENSWRVKKAIPSNLYDVKGRLITQFFSVEKRKIVDIKELPKNLVYALITREDRSYFEHNGFSLKGFLRAAVGVILRINAGGGSTITQQTVGQIGLVDRSIKSIFRKFVEIWYSIQLEKVKSKEEILDKYLNSVYFGHNTYGIESACQFYFNHSAKTISPAESAILVIQLSNPSLYSPIKHPERAKEKQKEVLDNMVKLGYLDEYVKEQSFKKFWKDFNYTRPDTASAFYNREDKAPYFSEYIRYYVQNRILLGDTDINKDGYNIYSTLNLDNQALANKYLKAGIKSANDKYQGTNRSRKIFSDENIVSQVNLLGMVFGVNSIKDAYKNKQKKNTINYYNENISPVVDFLALINGQQSGDLRDLTIASNKLKGKKDRKDKVEGALLTIDNSNGYISAMVGGSGFQSLNQFNRAMNARVEPGSNFKPLYYSKAIEKKVVTPATVINDAPTVFQYEDGTSYEPTNYNGTWEGEVSVRHALAQSMNVVSVKVLSMVGFDDAILNATKLMGIPKEDWKQRNFVKAYPLALGIVSVSPFEIAKAYASIENRGREVIPLTVRYITGPEGEIVAQPEKDLREAQAKNVNQILTEQAAYITVQMLRSTTRQVWGTRGTLTHALNELDVKWYRDVKIPIAGKTGTTQNWSDAWTTGFTPYYTNTVWIGFDDGGKSLGLKQTGAYTAGPIWARYMQAIHKGLKYKDFPIPQSGIVKVRITTKGGLLVPKGYKGHTMTEYFIKGTEPTTYYDINKDTEIRDHVESYNPELLINSNTNDEDFELEDYDKKIDKLIKSYTEDNKNQSQDSDFDDYINEDKNSEPDIDTDQIDMDNNNDTVEKNKSEENQDDMQNSSQNDNNKNDSDEDSNPLLN